MKLIHAFPVEAVQLEKDEIFSINAVDKKGFAGDYLLTYEDGSRAILTPSEAHAQLIDPEKGHIEDNSHIVTEEDMVEFKKNDPNAYGLKLGDVITAKELESHLAHLAPKEDEKPA